MINLLSFNYWFALSPLSFIRSAQFAIISFLIVLFLAYLFFAFYRKRKGFYKLLYLKLHDFFLTNLLLGLLLFFFEYQRVYFFSARFWWLIWLVFMLIWGFNIFKNFKKTLKNREEKIKEKEFKKYLP